LTEWRGMDLKLNVLEGLLAGNGRQLILNHGRI